MSTLKILLFFNLCLYCLSGCKNDQIKVNHLFLDSQPEQVNMFGEHFISTDLYERDMAITPDGKEFFYALGDYKQNYRSLVSVKHAEQGWLTPEILNISGKYQDIEPFYQFKNDRLYFASNRPIYGDSLRSDYNIWYSDRQNNTWQEPHPLDSIVNTPGDEFYPSIGNSGTLYFTATRKNGVGREDIFQSNLLNNVYQAPIPLDSNINTSAYEFNAYITPSEDLIIFSSFGRPDGLGGGDLYFSVKDEHGNWTPSKNMGENINSEKLDYCPFIDLERGNFYFTSDRITKSFRQLTEVNDLERISNDASNGFGNIYNIGIQNLDFKNHLNKQNN